LKQIFFFLFIQKSAKLDLRREDRSETGFACRPGQAAPTRDFSSPQAPPAPSASGHPKTRSKRVKISARPNRRSRSAPAPHELQALKSKTHGIQKEPETARQGARQRPPTVCSDFSRKKPVPRRAAFLEKGPKRPFSRATQPPATAGQIQRRQQRPSIFKTPNGFLKASPRWCQF